MIFPPSFLRLRIGRAGRRRPGLWLPLFLLWPLLLIGAVVVSAVSFLRALLSGRWRRLGRSALLGPRLLVLFCLFRRLLIHVRDEEQELLIHVL